ncbi:hypothetical protein ACFJIX_27495 [Roseateles sp. UC29_93]|uniref:hypothetical protein n=1 Tax=Roseateles sp. UC29_93 TaxID=3350177 RepID=UPI0036720FF6
MEARHQRAGPEGRRRQYAVDANNAKLIAPAIKTRLDAYKADIIAGKIKVADYMADNACKN